MANGRAVQKCSLRQTVQLYHVTTNIYCVYCVILELKALTLKRYDTNINQTAYTHQKDY